MPDNSTYLRPTSQAANQSPVESVLARLTPAQLIEAREQLGPLCLWCGAPGTLLCDGQLGPLASGLTCDAPICPQHADSMHIHGTLCGPNGCEHVDDTIDRCPACVDRKAHRERCDQRTPEAHGSMVREHAANFERGAADS